MAYKESFQEQTNIKVREPKKYQVIMLNDDFTTMEFVVSVLVDIFKKDRVTAEKLMMFVHQNGRAVVGTYSLDMAQTKTKEALRRAKAEGFPFRMLVEEA